MSLLADLDSPIHSLLNPIAILCRTGLDLPRSVSNCIQIQSKCNLHHLALNIHIRHSHTLYKFNQRTSSPGRAVTRSCLFANINTGTFLSLDSCSSSPNSWPLISHGMWVKRERVSFDMYVVAQQTQRLYTTYVSSNLLVSELSIT